MELPTKFKDKRRKDRRLLVCAALLGGVLVAAVFSVGLVFLESGEARAQTAGAVFACEHEVQTAQTNTVRRMYVSLTEYGSHLSCLDENGQEVRLLNQGDVVWVTDIQDGKARLYTGKLRQNLYADASCLSETQPGRLTRPIAEPTLSAEEAGEISIHIWKERRDLELLSDGEVIATYSIGLGGWPWDTKIAQGDSRTPEGSYYVCVRNANSRFYLSLGLSYPNKEDAARGYENGVITRRQKNAVDAAIDAGEQPPWNTGLGGEIMIHGCSEDGQGAESDWTAGCIAVDDAVMDILWRYCDIGTAVQIDP